MLMLEYFRDTMSVPREPSRSTAKASMTAIDRLRRLDEADVLHGDAKLKNAVLTRRRWCGK